MHPELDTVADPSASPAPRRWLRAGLVALVLALIPAALETQVRRGCPQFARVPGYGACSNIGGSRCGFCTYRCNDETVVRWNVCSQ